MNKKILLSLGSLAAITAPVAAVVACGFSSDPSELTAQEKIDAAIKGLSKEDFLKILDGKITSTAGIITGTITTAEIAEALNGLKDANGKDRGISGVEAQNIEIAVVHTHVSTGNQDYRTAIIITIKDGKTILNTFRLSAED